MKALITGAYGFIGRNLLNRLLYLDEFDEIVLVSRKPRAKITHPDKVIKQYVLNLGKLHDDEDADSIHSPVSTGDDLRVAAMLYDEKPDIIFHLAGNPTVKTDRDNPHQILADNITSTHQLAYYCPEGCKIILASSVIVYGNWLYDEIGLSPYDESHKTSPISVYGATKRASESILDSYVHAGKIEAVHARMCATVGTSLTHGVIFDFIKKMRSNNPYLFALGDEPGSFKPYCHIRDVVNALIMLATSGVSGAYNIVPDDYISITEVAKSVMEGTGIQKPIKWMGSKANWKGDNKYLICSNEKLKKLGWKLKFPNSYDAILDVVSNS
jgi:UDP-glucose 4-epimerase